ncbi:MAG: 6-bladed beta-propeller [Phycisphaerae bacterium]|nr:6-bladed beta-propeller [Phycisphaerae bacterium]
MNLFYKYKLNDLRTLNILISALTLALLCGGCGGKRGVLFPVVTPPVLWPEPPESPHVQYIGQLTSQDDLKKEVSPLEGLKRTLFGRDDIGVIVGPYALAVDGQQRLFVSDTHGSVIHCMNLDNREYHQFSQMDSGEKLKMPIGLTIIDKNVYVADSILKKIVVFDPQGNFKFSFGDKELRRPSGIAYNPYQQRLYVADSVLHVVMIFDKNGKKINQFGQHGKGNGHFNFPTHLWTDPSGTLYVSDTLNYRIQIFQPDGKFLFKFGLQGDRPGNFAHPSGLATDTSGNIYVCDRQYENIQVFDPKGQILMALGGEGHGPGKFWLPGGLFIDDNNRMYIADSYNNRVQVFQLLEVEKP